MHDEFDFHGPGRLPAAPTEALPGTEQKIRVMTERASRGEQLFHPLDGLRRTGRFPCEPERLNGEQPVQPAPEFSAALSPCHLVAL